MKKFLLFALILGLVTQLDAQRAGGPPPQGGQRPAAAPPSNALSKEAETALKNYEKAKADVTGKKAQDAGAWVKFGKSILSVYDYPAKNIWLGLSAIEARVVLKDQRPIGTEKRILSEEEYEVVHYSDKDLYYNAGGSLNFWVITKPLMPQNLLNEAFDAFKKAYELDTKGAARKDAIEGITVVQNRFMSEAVTAYSIGEFSLSSKNFGNSLLCSEHPGINKKDTLVVFNTGLTAFYAQEYERALQYIQNALDLGYSQDGSAYSYLAESYKAMGQPSKMESTLAEGFTKYPSNQAILIALINMYRENDEDPTKVMEYIHKAQTIEPNNESLYNAEGDFWKKLDDTEKALECYRKSIAINPNYLFGHINIGTSYYDAALVVQNKASDELDDKKYNALLEEMDVLLIKATDPLEKAFEITSDPEIQLDIALYLKNIYYRLQGRDDKYIPLHEKYRDIYENR